MLGQKRAVADQVDINRCVLAEVKGNERNVGEPLQRPLVDALEQIAILQEEQLGKRLTGSLVDANTAEMIVAKKNDQDIAVVDKYSAHYKFVGVYPLRPGVDLMLLVRRDLAEQQDQDLYKIYEYESK